ncbi:MAG: hypothetical protein KA537_00780 [Candidatus Moranbacteria bacterium]|nr:hypothetical protein [Candidatus Moranbacteria bacterium]
MKKIVVTKKNVLIIALLGLIVSYVLNNPLFFGICFDAYALSGHVYCHDKFGYLLSHLLFFALMPVLPFVIIVYRMRDEVFQAWWKFARWFVPIIILVTFLQNIAHQQGGLGGVAQGVFDFVVLTFLYILFILTSIIKIVLTRRNLKG